MYAFHMHFNVFARREAHEAREGKQQKARLHGLPQTWGAVTWTVLFDGSSDQHGLMHEACKCFRVSQWVVKSASQPATQPASQPATE